MTVSRHDLHHDGTAGGGWPARMSQRSDDAPSIGAAYARAEALLSLLRYPQRRRFERMADRIERQWRERQDEWQDRPHIAGSDANEAIALRTIDRLVRAELRRQRHERLVPPPGEATKRRDLEIGVER